MRTIIQLDTMTAQRVVSDIADDAPIPAYAFAISSALLPGFLDYLTVALGFPVTRVNFAVALNTFMAALGVDMQFMEAPASSVTAPAGVDFVRYLLSVGDDGARLYTTTGTAATVTVSKAATCQFSVADWQQFVVGAFGGGDEAVALAAIGEAMGSVVVDERT